MPLHRTPARVLVALSLVLLALVGVARAEVPAPRPPEPVRIALASHGVTRSGVAKLCLDAAAVCTDELRTARKRLPVHRGGTVTVALSRPASRLVLRFGGSRLVAARPVDSSGRRWRTTLPAQGRGSHWMVVVEAKVSDAEASLGFALLVHRHRARR